MTQLPTLPHQKRRSEPRTDPVIHVARSVDPVDDSWTISVPVLVWDAGYARKNIDVRLTESQANKLKSIHLGLEKQEATLENGKCVANPVDAIRWMLENAK